MSEHGAAIPCPKCGSEETVNGRLRHELREPGFQPDDAKLLTLTTRSTAPIRAIACLRCGALELSVDIDYTKKLMKDPGR